MSAKAATSKNPSVNINKVSPSVPTTSKWTAPAVLVCFLLSGATALTYEVVWVRMLTLIFGATTLSVGTVLAAYMSGLALGSWYWSRHADTTNQPLRLYALLEFGIAGAALLSPLLFGLLQGVYRQLFVGGFDDFSLLSVVRFLLCLPALLLPTFLMGGTLPVLARFYTTSLAHVGRGSGDLYAINTLGAVLGTVLAGFLFIPTLGVKGTLVAAVCVNVVLAAIVYRLSASWDLAHGKVEAEATNGVVPQHATEGHAQSTVSPETLRLTTIVLLGFSISGFAAMIYEVTWTRSLIQIFGNSTYAFTTMLASFLVGLAAGAALAGRYIDRVERPYFVFAILQLIIGTWAVSATPLIESLPAVFLRGFQSFGGSFGSLQLLQFITCCLLMLLTTMSLGATFPTVSKIFSVRAGSTGKSVGLPYATNTVGTVFGALCASFILLPRIGIEYSILIGAMLNLLVCGVVLLTSRQTALKPSLLVALFGLCCLACVRLAVWRLDPRMLSSGVYMYPEYFLSEEKNNRSIQEAVELKKVLLYREGYGTSIAVVQLGNEYIALQANGKTDASTGDLSSQRGCAHLPMLLKPDTRESLIVGLASGCTVGSTLLHPVQRVDCVEIEPAMVEAARFFDKWNYRCLDDKRLTLHLQDARNYIMMSDKQYDEITAEPTNPWIAGVNNLFTQEYYRQCAARLKPDGVMCQWFPAYNFSEAELRTALGTYASVFPYVTVWAFPNLREDFFAIGSKVPLQIDPATIAAKLKGPLREDIQAMGIPTLWKFAGGLLMDENATREFGRNVRLNTDERPLLEFSTPRHLYETESKIQALHQAYQTGQSSRLQLKNEDGPTALELLDPRLKLSKNLRVTEAALVPHHPSELGRGNTLNDVAELVLKLQTPEGPATLHAMPLPHEDWPESLVNLWVSATPLTDLKASASKALIPQPNIGQSSVVRVSVVYKDKAALMWEVPAGTGARERLLKLAGMLPSS